ncbi:MAG: M16 family metallopeptidase [Myxococcota bacterium]
MIRTQLENGLRVVIDDSGKSDVAAVYLWIDSGSAAEPAGLEGAAHFLEHMVFKGTRRFGVGEVAAAVEALGGDLNAWTAFDETVFHATVPAREAPAALAVLAEMMREARLDADELERERLVVLEEIRGGEDDPDLLITEATYATAYPGHAYGRPIIGTTKSVAAIPRDALRDFYRAWYQPANACLAVAGPVDAGAVLDAARRCLSGGSPAPASRAGEPIAKAGARTLRKGFEASLVELGFPGPGHTHPDVPALDVVCTALGAGSSAPIEARLRTREGLCLAAGMHYEAEARAGMAVVSLHVHPGRANDAIAVAREEVARARAGDVDPALLARAKTQIVAERVFGRESADGRAHALAFHTERMGSPDAWKAYEAAVLAVTPDDVARVTARWLAPEREVAVALLPRREKVDLAARASAPPPARARVPALHRLDNGVRVLLEPDDGDTFAARVVGFGGQLGEPGGGGGRAVAWARAIARGTEEMDALDFAAEVEALGGAVGAGASRSTQWVRAETLARHAGPGLELLLDALLRPAFDADEVARVRGEMEAALAERDDEPDQLAMEALWALACPGHPYGRPPGGTPASVARVSPAALRAHHAAWLRGENLVVSVTGGFDPDRVLRRLTRALGRLPSASRAVTAPDPAFPRETRRRTIRCGREQAHLAVAWPGVRVDDPAQPEAELLAAVLGGQGGRLFAELREQHGLAYGVGAVSQEGVRPGLVVAWLATDPARAREAEARLLEVVGRLAVEEVGADELARVKRYLSGASAMDLQTTGARATAAALAELYGLGGLHYRTLVERRIEPIDARSLRARAATLLARPLAVARVLPRRGGS